jgi:hypothetical protein
LAPLMSIVSSFSDLRPDSHHGRHVLHCRASIGGAITTRSYSAAKLEHRRSTGPEYRVERGLRLEIPSPIGASSQSSILRRATRSAHTCVLLPLTGDCRRSRLGLSVECGPAHGPSQRGALRHSYPCLNAPRPLHGTRWNEPVLMTSTGPKH